MNFEVRTKKWGNSIGVIIPSETVEQFNIKSDEKMFIEISKKENVLQELFGALKFKKSTQQTLIETRKDLESKWLK